MGNILCGTKELVTCVRYYTFWTPYHLFQATQTAFWNLHFEGYNQNYFRVGDVSWNKGTSINMSSTSN